MSPVSDVCFGAQDRSFIATIVPREGRGSGRGQSRVAADGTSDDQHGGVAARSVVQSQSTGLAAFSNPGNPNRRSRIFRSHCCLRIHGRGEGRGHHDGSEKGDDGFEHGHIS